MNRKRRVVFENGNSLVVNSQAEINRIPRRRGEPDWWVVEDDEEQSQRRTAPSTKSLLAPSTPKKPKRQEPQGLPVVFEDGRTRSLRSERDTRNIPRGPGKPDWWVTKRPDKPQSPSRTGQDKKPAASRAGSLLNAGGAAAKTRGMRVPVGGPLGGPVGFAWDIYQLGKRAVDEYGKRMKKGEKYAQEQLDIEFDANVDDVGACVDDCIFQNKSNDCYDRCNEQYGEKFNPLMGKQKNMPTWYGRWLFKNKE